MRLSHITFVVNLALLTLAAYWGVGIFYQFAGAQIMPTEDTAVTASDTAPDTNVEPHPLAFYQPIIERDLFDTQKTPQAPVSNDNINVDELEATELKLRLWGTVSGNDNQAYAVIEDLQKHEQNLYRIGDSIQNAIVKKIMRARVVLTLDGKDQVLAMEDLQQGTPASSRFVNRTASRVTPGQNPATSIQRAQRVSLRREMINDAMKDISKLMTEIVIRPHLENGQPDGLALSNIKPNSIFRRMGLRNGDVLKGVDGNEIQSVDDALKLYENLKDSDSVQVTLSRRGQDRIINYNIR